MVEKKLLATYKDGTGNFVNIGTKYTVPLFYHLLPLRLRKMLLHHLTICM